jgi:hypothetical protein
MKIAMHGAANADVMQGDGGVLRASDSRSIRMFGGTIVKKPIPIN